MLVLVGMLCATREFEIIRASPYTDIDVETAYNMITNGSFPELVFLDVRTQSEYDSGHIYGAVWIPVGELEARIGELSGHKDHEIIVYCLSGGRSVTASGILDSNNFTKVHNLLGGISAWHTAGYPTWIATVHNVDTAFNYDIIQAAIDANETLDGHTIFVEEGIYYENIILNKSLSLSGENRSKTIVDGNYTQNVITIVASNVNITGFTFQKSWMGTWPYFNGAGIYMVEGSSGNNISYNLIIDNRLDGIRLNATSNNIISHNILLNNTGSGITIFSSSGNIISNNTILEGSSGINVCFSSNNTISENNVLNNSFFGITLAMSGYNQLFGNNMDGNCLNFGVDGYSKSDFNNSVGTSNLVDGKSVHYLQGVDDIVLDSQLNIGTLYLINCENVTVQDLFLSNNSFGLLLWETRNSTIENLRAKNNYCGIHLKSSTNITISGNYITNNVKGIWLNSSNVCSISGNNVEANHDRGIVLELSSNNSILGNDITSNRCDGIVIAEGVDNCVFENSVIDNNNGVLLFSTSSNKFYHNNFVGKSPQILFIGPVYTNYWDNSVEGNYWSDYTDADSNHDGIGDSYYIIYANNTDHCPLMGMFHSFDTSLGDVHTICNSTISDFQCYYDSENQTNVIKFNVNGTEGIGFCRICIPHTILNETYTVLVDGHEPDYMNLTLYDDGTHHWIYFTYQHSIHEITIISEFPSFLILPLFMIASLVAVIAYKRKHSM